MSRTPKPSQPAHGEGPSRHPGTEQHGWSPDVDSTHTQENPSAHRSFHPEKYAPKPGPGRTVSKEETKGTGAKTGESSGRRGEDLAKKGDDGMHDLGPKGRSGRPSGTRDASAVTGVDPQDASDESGSH
ncbi:hypothetical protein AB0D46_27305 [Streptomyces sp. NPDC048383]|uniref:hypothetical protein n=1 Tax=Streptomyces sp. NPDC048383 TaxID=3155386 RepID=UPI0034404033